MVTRPAPAARRLQGHASVEPDSELILATAATAGNVGDAAAAPELLAELVARVEGDPSAATAGSDAGDPAAAHPLSMATAPMAPGRCWPACTPPASTHGSRSKPRSPKGHFTKDQFQIDLVAGAVTCPARRTVPILYSADPDNRHHGQARFGLACTACPLRGQCTSAAAGRTVTITAYEHELAAARHLSGRPRPRCRLPRDPAQGRAQAGPSGPPPPRRPPKCGSAAWSRSLPTSACWPPRSTWPGWACSACTGAPRMAGQQHDSAPSRPPAPVPLRYQHRLCPSRRRGRVQLLAGDSSTLHLTSTARFTPAT